MIERTQANCPILTGERKELARTSQRNSKLHKQILRLRNYKTQYIIVHQTANMATQQNSAQSFKSTHKTESEPEPSSMPFRCLMSLSSPSHVLVAWPPLSLLYFFFFFWHFFWSPFCPAPFSPPIYSPSTLSRLPPTPTTHSHPRGSIMRNCQPANLQRHFRNNPPTTPSAAQGHNNP